MRLRFCEWTLCAMFYDGNYKEQTVLDHRPLPTRNLSQQKKNAFVIMHEDLGTIAVKEFILL